MKWFMMRVVIASLCVSMSYASWQNSLFLRELNNFQDVQVASRPTISSDEKQILFVRVTQQGYYYLWQAQKNSETGIFGQSRILSELNSLGGRNIFGTWLSKDSLRLYYCADDPKAVNGTWGRNLLMAIRKSPADKWVPQKIHSELQLNQYASSASLTCDELYIMWTTDNNGANFQIYTASRPSVFHNFSNITQVHELETIGAKSPYLSLDGLTVYFMREFSPDNRQSWIGHRISLNEPFTVFSPIVEINNKGIIYGNLCPSWDGKKAYYFQRQGLPGDLNTTGIFVSEWVDDSYVDAVRILQEAIVHKEQAVQLIQDASDKEKMAMQILDRAFQVEIPAGVSEKDIQQSIKSIHMALQRQRLIQQMLKFNLHYLDTALILLLPPLPVE